jgi:hypothetical protein
MAGKVQHEAAIGPIIDQQYREIMKKRDVVAAQKRKNISLLEDRENKKALRVGSSIASNEVGFNLVKDLNSFCDMYIFSRLPIIYEMCILTFILTSFCFRIRKPRWNAKNDFQKKISSTSSLPRSLTTLTTLSKLSWNAQGNLKPG